MTLGGNLIFATYLIIGPVAWSMMLLLLFIGRQRMTRLLRNRKPVPQPAPSVTILVPAKDEAAGIAHCIDCILEQDYPDFRIVAINDRSTDRTGAILDELCARQPGKLCVVHIAPESLPDGWLGKCNALHVGAGQADGDWLFFVDSDVTLQPDALSRAIALVTWRRYDALSILTKLECHTFWERLVLPLVGGAWSVMHAISLTNDDRRPGSAVANGQFLLIRRSAYATVGGHESVRAAITEDVEMMRLLKGRGFRTRLMLGSHLAATRMHSSLGQMFHGWGRILSGSSRRSPRRIIGAMLFLLICGFGVYPALAWGLAALRWNDPGWLIVSVLHLLLMTVYLALIYRWSGNRARYALLFPLGGGVLLGILAFALRTCRTGRVMWRETQFQIPAHARLESDREARDANSKRKDAGIAS